MKKTKKPARYLRKTRREHEEDQELEQEIIDALRAQELDEGKWIMIRSHISVQEHVRPPFMSIHWSTPWAHGDVETIIRSKKRDKSPMFGQEPDLLNARKILFGNEEVRVYPHEFSVVSTEIMALYTMGCEGSSPSHRLVAGSAAEHKVIAGVMDGEQRSIYDAALVDGAEPGQAFRVALELDVLEAVEFPPLGWYECVPEYRRMFDRDFHNELCEKEESDA